MFMAVGEALPPNRFTLFLKINNWKGFARKNYRKLPIFL
jgi:hypothetical protein